VFLPITTDAEVRHWPIATVSMIGVHVIVFALQCALPEIPLEVDGSVEVGQNSGLGAEQEFASSFRTTSLPGWWPYALSHGDGLHPIQWITSFLIHGNFCHLLGNMMFLWVFGLLVEGFGGPWKFLALYLGIGVFQNIAEQLIYLPFGGIPSLGASSAIFGLMMIAALWAPQDHIQCFLYLFYQPRLLNVPMLIMAALYFLMNLATVLFTGFALGSSLLHLMGAVVGLGAGWFMLRNDWVDCDDRDLGSMIRGDRPRSQSRRQVRRAAEEHQRKLLEADQRIEIGWRSFDMHLSTGHLSAALRQLNQLQLYQKTLQWTEPRLWELIRRLLKDEQYDRAFQFAETYVARFSERVDSMRLIMAQIVGLKRGLPVRGLKILRGVDPDKLNPRQRATRDSLVAELGRQVSEGALEPEDD
jgi:membrane associated rhomboid family serine protease